MDVGNVPSGVPVSHHRCEELLPAGRRASSTSCGAPQVRLVLNISDSSTSVAARKTSNEPEKLSGSQSSAQKGCPLKVCLNSQQAVATDSPQYRCIFMIILQFPDTDFFSRRPSAIKESEVKTSFI